MSPYETRLINCLPVASRNPNERSNTKLEFEARSQQAVTALGRSAKKSMRYIILIALTLISAGCATPRPETTPPTIGGQAIPDNNVIIDFTKRYDIHWRKGEEAGVFRNSKIIGYTGDTVKDSSGSFSKGYSNFGSWLVIDPAEGGQVYLPQSMVTFFQLSSR